MRRADFYDSLERWRASTASSCWNYLPLCCFLQRQQEQAWGSGSLHHNALDNETAIQSQQCSVTSHHASQQNRLVFFGQLPREFQRCTLLACSRYPTNDPVDGELANVLRTWLVHASLANPRPVLISGQGLTLDAMLTAVAPQFQLPLVRLIPPKAKNAIHWLKRFSLEATSPDPLIQSIFISPAIVTDGDFKLDLDAVAFQLAGQVQAMLIKSNSKTGSLMSNRLSDLPMTKTEPPVRSHIWVPCEQAQVKSNLVAAHRKLAMELMQQGAVGWYLPAEMDGQQQRSASSESQVQPFPSSFDNEFLFHHTRGCSEAWPEETEEERWLRWLTQTQTSGAMQTLLRIVTQGRLRGGGNLIPSGKPMVCFSQRPPRDSVAARCFRSHLSRWDYEPYGVAVRKQRLVHLGAKPVCYWDEATETLPSSAIEFTQKRFSQSESGKRVDWSKEREYRLPDDLDLASLPAKDVILFVPTAAEARQLAAVSRWPVGFLNQTNETLR